MNEIQVRTRQVERPESHVYLMVMPDGEVRWDEQGPRSVMGVKASDVPPRVRYVHLHEASLIIVRDDDGSLVVWKERFGFLEPGTVLAPHQVGILAAVYVVMSDPRWYNLGHEPTRLAVRDMVFPPPGGQPRALLPR